MNVAMEILAVVLGLAGIVGSIIPVLPGPPISFLGILLLYFWGGTNGAGEPMSLVFLMVWCAVVVVVTVLDYIVPMFFTRLTGGSRYASWGTVLGMIAGIVFTPVGMIAGAFVGAFVAELIWADKTAGSALKSAVGAFVGFITGTGMKLVTTGVMMYYIIVYL